MAQLRLSAFAATLVALLWPITLAAQSDVEWRHYSGDQKGSKYSPADQIDARNVGTLREAWRWRSPDAEIDTKMPAHPYKSTPLMVGGRVYVITGLNVLHALDARSGETVWSFDPKAYERGRVPHGGYNSRGVEFWTDGEQQRIVATTTSLQLVAVDAVTGEPAGGFGEDGIVDMREGLGREFNVRDIGVNAAPTVCGDVVVVGSIINDFVTKQAAPPGHVRGFDVRTGKQLWIFHTIPQGVELGADTWENESWKVAGNTNVWSMMSCDAERGIVYLPVGTPTNDHYGGHRLGDNLFAESLVALDARTGERKWHFQAVKHGVWDYDFPAAPNLVDITVDGKEIAAVAQISKQAFTYVFDRVTGEPVWPIEQRRVAASKVPGERTAETQPFPTKPPPFDRQGITDDDLIDFTPELREKAREIVADFVIGPLFTPPIVAGQDGKKGLIQVPGMAGGANWGGAAFDAETGMLYVPSQSQALAMGLREPDASRSDFRYDRGFVMVNGPEGLPLLKPPYARITAIDLNQGTIAWQVPHGQGPTDHEAIEHLDLGPLGAHSMAGLAPGWPLLTKTLLFAAQAIPTGQGSILGGGPAKSYLRAFDKATGEQLAELEIDGAINGAPMTYVTGGRQYVLTPVATEGTKGELVAWALP